MGTILLLSIAFVFLIPVDDGKTVFQKISKNETKYLNAALADKMVVTNVSIKERITGQKPFDTGEENDYESVDDGSLLSNMDGIDVSGKDNIVRTNDKLFYIVQLAIGLNDSIEDNNVCQPGGVIKFKVTIPKDQYGTKFYFVNNDYSNTMYKNISVEEVDEGEFGSLVLTGIYEADSNEMLCGGIKDLSFIIGVNNKKSEDLNHPVPESLKPVFEFWMEGNKNDNDKSTKDAITIVDVNDLFISGKYLYYLELKNGVINNRAKLDGIDGNYVNFGVSLQMAGVNKDLHNSYVGSAYFVAGKVDMDISFDFLYSKNGVKYNSVPSEFLEKVKLIAFNKSSKKFSNSLAWPDEFSNVLSNVVSGTSNVDFGKINVSIDESQKNKLHLTMTDFYNNNSYHNTILSNSVIYDAIEMFFPYYLENESDNSDDYSYRVVFKIDNYTIDSPSTSSIELSNIMYDYNLVINNSLKKVFTDSILTTATSNLSGMGAGTRNPVFVGMKNVKTSVKFSISDGEYDGEENLIVWDNSKAILNKEIDVEKDVSISNSGIFPSQSFENFKILYGVIKGDKAKDKYSFDDLKNFDLSDFEWYENYDDILEKEKISAIHILNEDYIGYNQELVFINYFDIVSDSSNAGEYFYLLLKSRLYLDWNQKIVAYEEWNEHKNGINYIESPIVAYGFDTEVNFDSPSIKNNSFDASIDYLNIRITPNILNTSFEGRDNIIYQVSFPSEFKYVNNSSNYDPESIVKNKLNTIITWKLEDYDISLGKDVPELVFSLDIPRLSYSQNYKMYAGVYGENNGASFDITKVGGFCVFELKSAAFNIVSSSGIYVQLKSEDKYVMMDDKFKFVSGIYNYTTSSLDSIQRLIVLPQNDVNGSKFSGAYKLSIDDLKDNQELYYSDLDYEDIVFNEAVDDSKARTIDFSNGWTKLEDGKEIPNGVKLITIVDEDLESNTVISNEFEVEPIQMDGKNNQVGDKYIFKMYGYTEAVISTLTANDVNVIVYDRSVSGKAYIDKNKDNEYDSEDELIKGIDVNLYNDEDDVIATTKTDDDGNYSFNDLEKGKYYLSFDYDSDNYDVLEISNTDYALMDDGKTNILEGLDINPTEGNIVLEDIDFGIVIKQGTVTENHYLGDTLDYSDTKTYDYKEDYETSARTYTNYKLKQTPSNASGVVNGNIIVNYYYELKEAKIIVKYLEYETEKELDDSVEIDVHYGDEYETEASLNVTANYVLKSVTDNAAGVVQSDEIEVIYYYQKKESNIDFEPLIGKCDDFGNCMISEFDYDNTKKISSKNDSIDYEFTFKPIIRDYLGDVNISLVINLPYPLIEEESTLDGGIYDAEEQTITWIKKEENVDASVESQTLEFNMNVSLVFDGIDATKRTLVSNAEVKIELDNNNFETDLSLITIVEIPSRIVIRYIDLDNNELLAPDVIKESLVGDEIETMGITIDGYELVEEPTGKLKFLDNEVDYVYGYKKVEEVPLFDGDASKKINDGESNPPTGIISVAFVFILLVVFIGFKIKNKSFKNIFKI